MDDINNLDVTDKKWKYVDKQFCSEVLTLADTPAYEDNSDAYPSLQKLVKRVEQMEKDVCNSSCPSMFKNCKCYRSQNLTPDKTNDVFCAMIQDGFVFACPESCCTNGSGCSEPARRGRDASEYPQIPEGELIDLEDAVDSTESGKLSPGAIAIIVINVIIFVAILGGIII